MTAFSVAGKDLAAAASFVHSLAPARPADPALGGVVIDVSAPRRGTSVAGDGLATFCVYDGDTAGTVTLAAHVDAPGKVLVSARLLDVIAATLTGEAQVTLRRDGDEVIITAGSSMWKLPTLDLRHYPEMPVPGVMVGELDAAVLASALSRVLPAAGAPGAVPMFGGVCLNSEDGSALTVATTNRWRLAIAEVDWKGGKLDDLLVPASLLGMAQTVARRETSSTVQLCLADRKAGISLVGQTYSVTGRLIASPNPGIWRRVERAMGDRATTVVVDAAALRQAITRTAVVLDPTDAVRLRVVDGTVLVDAVLGKRSNTEHLCEAMLFDGPNCASSLEAGYLSGAIAALSSETVVLQFAAKDNDPVLLLPGDADGNVICDFRYIIAAKQPPAAATA